MRTWVSLFVFVAVCSLLEKGANAADVSPAAEITSPNGSTLAEKPRRIAYTAGYLGELLFHPGVIVGLESPLAETRGGPRHGAFLLAGNFGSYVHIRNNIGFMVDAEAGYRLTFGSGFLVEGFAGIGYLHTFLAAPTYAVGDDGDVTRIVDLGRPAFMPTVSVGAGWQFDKLAPFLRVESFGQYPFNHHLLPHFALLLGVRV